MSEEKAAREALESSRVEVMECEQEIQSIKNALKALALSTDGATMNSLRVSVHKVTSSDGSSEIKPTKFKINLSSPIEDRLITKLYDPLDPTAEGSFAEFTQIEAANALVTVEAFSESADEDGAEGDEGNKLGVSAAHDLLPLCEGAEKKTLMVDFAIVSESGETVEGAAVAEEKIEAETTETVETEKEGEEETEDAAAEEESKPEESEKEAEAATDEAEKEGEDKSAEPVTEETATDETPKEGEIEAEEKTAEEAEESKPAQDATDAPSSTESPTEEEAPTKEEITETATTSTTTESKLQLPLCTISIQLEYTPSPTDKRDVLYDKLNEVSKRKAAAIEKLRQSATAMNRIKAAEAGEDESNKEGAIVNKKPPAVKAGFLNKPSGGAAGKAATAAQPPFWKRWYEKTIGPSSLLWVIGPVAKNYVIFLGISAFFHYKGDLLALPPPV